MADHKTNNEALLGHAQTSFLQNFAKSLHGQFYY